LSDTRGTVATAMDEQTEQVAIESAQSSRNAEHTFPDDLMQQGRVKKQRLAPNDAANDNSGSDKAESLTGVAVPEPYLNYQEYIDQIDVKLVNIGNS